MMSDSDDTDFLLFIPPNFFNVSSPECLFPSYVEEDLGITCCNSVLPSINSIKQDDMEVTTTSLLNRVNGKPSISYNLRNFDRSNGLETSNALESTSPIKHEPNKSFMRNTWPEKKVNSANMAGNEMKFSADEDKSRTNSKMNQSLGNTPGKIPQDSRLSKFNLSQVDQLLIEMEKTRTEIKSKLVSNKNKIHEMRRECMGNNIDVNPHIDRNNRKPRMESFDASKSVSDILKETDVIISTHNSDCPEKNQSDFDVNFVLPGGSKNMLQLSQILSLENNTESLQQKLEAEIMKKKHCEEIIQELQLKLLEQQQNLNVAQKVDAEKEKVIKQLRSAWLQLVEHWKELEQQRQELALMLEQERVEARNMSLNFSQKVETLENRLHETITLASGYHQKNEELNRSLKNLQESVVEFGDNFKKMEEYTKLVELEKSNIFEQLRQTNENLTEEKQKLFSSETRITDLENQTAALISEKNDLSNSLRDEKKTVSELKNEVLTLREDCSRLSNSEFLAVQQMSTMKQEVLKVKNNLKDFYQNQLDLLLKKKVDEFHKEFQKAQNVMRQELIEYERIADERFQSELKHLQDSQKIELSEEKRVNQKHVNILKAELKETRKKIYELENRLKSDSSSKVDLAKRMRSLLKSQWMEALSVISGNEELSKDFLALKLNAKNSPNTQNLENEDESSDFDLISSKSQKIPLDLRNYISMLLDKEPGNPVDEYKNLEFLLSGQKAEASEKRSSSEVAKNFDNFRQKPPWK